jgi:hypothetical protein
MNSLKWVVRCACVVAGLSLSAAAADAAPVTYKIVADTSSLAGQTQNLNFIAAGQTTVQNVGIPLNDSVTITGFTTNGSIAEPGSTVGTSSGSLATTLVIDDHNASQNTTYSVSGVLGTSLSFFATLDGDQFLGIEPVEYAGFNFMIGTNQLLLPNPSGFGSAEIYQDGSGSLVTESNAAISITLVPEPAAAACAGVIGGFVLASRRNRKTRSH